MSLGFWIGSGVNVPHMRLARNIWRLSVLPDGHFSKRPGNRVAPRIKLLQRRSWKGSGLKGFWEKEQKRNSDVTSNKLSPTPNKAYKTRETGHQVAYDQVS